MSLSCCFPCCFQPGAEEFAKNEMSTQNFAEELGNSGSDETFSAMKLANMKAKYIKGLNDSAINLEKSINVVDAFPSNSEVNENT